MIVVGPALERLEAMPDRSVQCVVTSPPYYGLRDYGTGEWTGGDPECSHAVQHKGRGVWLGDGDLDGGEQRPHVAGAPHRGGARERACRCGAVLDDDQLGLEATPTLYVEALTRIFREVRRVLRDDGVAWLNLGDSYNAGGPLDGTKPKDLIGIPWRVALALQADGWYLRSDVIWHKPNAMPSSVTDRPTTGHEYVFLLSKAERYWYDADAIREPLVAPDGPWGGRTPREGVDVNGGGQASEDGFRGYVEKGGRNKRSVWSIRTRPYKEAHFATFPPDLVEPCILAGSAARSCSECGTPWQRITERTTSFESNASRAGATLDEIAASGKHSDFPGNDNLRAGPVVTVRTLGWRPGCVCGGPDELQADDMEVIESPTGERAGEDPSLEVGRGGFARPRGDGEGTRPITRFEQRWYAKSLRALAPAMRDAIKGLYEFTDTEWEHYLRYDRAGARPLPAEVLDDLIAKGVLIQRGPPVYEPPEPVPSVVLDPFAGSGTVGVVCGWHGREFVGIELNPEYAAMAERRIAIEGKPSGRKERPPVVSEAQESLFA